MTYARRTGLAALFLGHHQHQAVAQMYLFGSRQIYLSPVYQEWCVLPLFIRLSTPYEHYCMDDFHQLSGVAPVSDTSNISF